MICLHEWVRCQMPVGTSQNVEAEHCWKCEKLRRRWRGGPWEQDRSPVNHARVQQLAKSLHPDACIEGTL